jgi:hypothetical protein
MEQNVPEKSPELEKPIESLKVNRNCKIKIIGLGSLIV